MTSKLKCPEHKHSYLVVYNAQSEKGQYVGDVEIKTTLPLAYTDLDETRQIIANKCRSDKEHVVILNIIPMRVEHKE
ncbi:MAG: hypothetical protein ACLRFN_01675, partial [Alphaproteobacteria bacterium]